MSESVVREVRDTIQTLVREIIRVGTAQPDDLWLLIADRIVSDVPYWLGGDDWQKGVRSVVGDVLPWLTCNSFGDLILLLIELDIAKQPENRLGFKLYGSSERHMAFWTTLALYNARAEMRSTISLYLREFCSAVSGDKHALFEWLAGNDGRVSDILQKFENDPAYHNLDEYSWSLTPEGRHSRLDYLVLSGLVRKGRLPPLEQRLGELLEKWVHEFVKDGMQVCPTCKALGVVPDTEQIPCPNPKCGNGKIKVKCPKCDGAGKVEEKVKGCRVCRGSKKMEEKRTIGHGRFKKTVKVKVRCPCNFGEIVLKMVKAKCPKCEGDKVLRKKCPKCEGDKFIKKASEKGCQLCHGRKVIAKVS